MSTELGMLINVKQSGIKEAEQNLNSMADAAGRAEEATDGFVVAAKKSGGAAKEASSGYSTAARDAKQLRESIRSMNSIASQNADGMRLSGLKAEEYHSSLSKLKEAAQSGGASMHDLASASMKAGDGIVTLQSKTGEALAVLQRVSYSAKEAGMSAAEYELRLKELSKTAWKNGATLKDLNSSHIEVTESSYHLISAQRDVLTSMARGKDQIRATANEADFFSGKLTTLYRAMDSGGGATGRYNISLASFDGYAKRARQSAEELSRANARVAKASAIAASGMDVFSSYLTGFVTMAGARSIVAMSDAMTNMNAQIRLTTSSTAEFNLVQKELVGIAGRTYTSLEGTANLYSKTAQATKGLGISQKEILKYTEAVNYALGVGGVSAQGQASAFLQLSQAMNSGKMSMQDYKAIMAQAPIIMKEMAAALGTNIKGLEGMIASGDLTVKEMLKLGRASGVLGEQFAKMPITMGQAMTDLKNNLLGVNDQLTNTSGVMSVMASAVSTVARNLDIVVPVLGGMAVSLAVASGAMTKLNLAMLASPMGMFAGAIGLVAANTDYAKEAITLFAGVMAGRYLSAIVASNGALVSQKLALAASTVASGAASVAANGFSVATSAAAIKAGVLTVATTWLKTAFALLGGPVGVVTLAVVALVGWASSASRAREEAQGLALEVDKLAGSYKTLTAEQSKNAREKAESDQYDLDREVKDAKKQLDAAKYLLKEENERRSMWTSKIFGDTGEAYAKMKVDVNEAEEALKSAAKAAETNRKNILNLKGQEKLGGPEQASSENTKRVEAQKEANDRLKEWRENNAKLAVGEETYIINKLKAAGATDEQVAALQREADKRQEILDKQKESNRVAKEAISDAQLLKGLRLKSSESTGGGSAARGTLEMAKSIQDSLGKNLKYFSALNDQWHKSNRPNSLHTKGLAFDAAVSNRAAGEASVGQITKYLESLGFVKGKDFFAQFEKAGEKGATGDHLHFQWQNKAAADRFAQHKATGMKYGEQMGGYGGKDSEAEAAKQYASALAEISQQINGIQNARNDIQDFGFESQYSWLREFNQELDNAAGKYADLSARQKEALRGLAEIKSDREQMLGIEKFAAASNESLSALAFENQLIGKTRLEVEQLTYARQLDIEVKKLSAGMSDERIADLTAEAERIRNVREEIVATREEVGRDLAGGIRDGLIDFVESAGTLREQFASATSSTMNTLGDAIGGMVTGARTSFRDLTASIMADLAKIAMRMAMMNLLSGVAGMFTPTASASATGFVANGGNWGSAGAMQYGGLMGFAGGGYTGDGGKYEIAGPAHRGEYIFTKEETSRIGVRNLQNLAKSGYANGGFVGGPAGVVSGGLGQGRGMIVNVTINKDDTTDVSITDQFGQAMSHIKQYVDVRVQSEVSGQLANEQRDGGSLSRRR